MLKKTHRILSIFAQQPWKRFTFKEAKELSGSTSESYVYNSLKGFVKEGILSQEQAGNVLLYSVSSSQKAIAYLSAAEHHRAWNRKDIPLKEMEALMSNIPTASYTFIITGSYANSTQKKNSDIDVVIIAHEPKRIYAELSHLCELSIPPVHLYAFTEQEFSRMLLDRNENYGKELARNNLILRGAETYFEILLEAIQHGFNG